ncbi:30S ribosomal protein S3 [Candidatus Vidania fulgoroideae]|uniref:Small ribosomal subunit protein uS3 n=1 Tax=Candidatus Vidania fulgoroideorum TaxID=881286 RepID=A0AAX3NA95_9PROT|nr:30S ribosomal protein S3 [Candidatus Vidania fulgoroideae]
MGNKINALGFRIPKFYCWNSKWILNKKNLIEDIMIRSYIKKNFENKYINNIFVEKSAENYIVLINSSKPGIIIGRLGINIKNMKRFFKKRLVNVYISVKETINLDINSDNISKNICFSIEKRKNYKRIINIYMEKAMNYAIRGIKITISGRLNGSDIARRETFKLGKVQLIKINNKVSYTKSISKTKYGIICIKVWINF